MNALHPLLAQPEDVQDIQPDLDRITREGRRAVDAIWSARARSWRGAARRLHAHGGPLARLILLRAHQGLGEFNNFLLPPLITLILVELATGGLPGMMRGQVDQTDLLFCACFLAEWALGLGLARRRSAYLRNLWLLADLVAALPLGAVFQAARLSRFGRLLRFVKLVKLARARRFRIPVGRFLRAVGAAFSVATAGAFALEAVEPDLVDGWLEAMWWSVVTLTTVGYGDIAPVSLGGRLVGLVLMVSGVGVFSYLAGLTASVVFDPEEDHILRTVTRLEQKLDALADRLDAPR